MRMLVLVALLAILALLGAPTESSAEPPRVVMQDPRVYAEGFARRLRENVGTLRETYIEFSDSPTLSPQLDAALSYYESGAAGRPASVSEIIDDVAAGNAVRSIYIYNYYGDNIWLFTRLDFVRISDTQWAVATLAFAGEWTEVVSPLTPGFRSPSENR